jgi:hypothetical protein
LHCLLHEYIWPAASTNRSNNSTNLGTANGNYELLIESYLYFLSLEKLSLFSISSNRISTGYRALRTFLVTAHVTGLAASGVRAPDHDRETCCLSSNVLYIIFPLRLNNKSIIPLILFSYSKHQVLTVKLTEALHLTPWMLDPFYRNLMSWHPVGHGDPLSFTVLRQRLGIVCGK